LENRKLKLARPLPVAVRIEHGHEDVPVRRGQRPDVIEVNVRTRGSDEMRPAKGDIVELAADKDVARRVDGHASDRVRNTVAARDAFPDHVAVAIVFDDEASAATLVSDQVIMLANGVATGSVVSAISDNIDIQYPRSRRSRLTDDIDIARTVGGRTPDNIIPGAVDPAGVAGGLLRCHGRGAEIRRHDEEQKKRAA
jgi:hypothetical protein